jgi:hypothetical protein
LLAADPVKEDFTKHAAPSLEMNMEDDIAKWKTTHPRPFGPDPDALTGKDRAAVRAHLAFALLDCVVTSHAGRIQAQGIPLVYERGETTIRLKLGLRALVLGMTLQEEAVRVTFASVSLYTGEEKAQLAATWPPADLPQECMHEAAEALANDARAFLLRGSVP